METMLTRNYFLTKKTWSNQTLNQKTWWNIYHLIILNFCLMVFLFQILKRFMPYRIMYKLYSSVNETILFLSLFLLFLVFLPLCRKMCRYSVLLNTRCNNHNTPDILQFLSLYVQYFVILSKYTLSVKVIVNINVSNCQQVDQRKRRWSKVILEYSSRHIEVLW